MNYMDTNRNNRWKTRVRCTSAIDLREVGWLLNQNLFVLSICISKIYYLKLQNVVRKGYSIYKLINLYVHIYS